MNHSIVSSLIVLALIISACSSAEAQPEPAQPTLHETSPTNVPAQRTATPTTTNTQPLPAQNVSSAPPRLTPQGVTAAPLRTTGSSRDRLWGVWTVILASLGSAEHSYSDAVELAATTPISTNVLLSDDYPSLNTGYWVLYTGAFAYEAAAAARCGELKLDGLDCYHRFVGDREPIDSSNPIDPPVGAWTVILASLDVAATTLEQASDWASRHRDIPTGVLLSSDFDSLNSGYWVVYSGVFDTEDEAAAYCRQLQEHGRSCYQRYVGNRLTDGSDREAETATTTPPSVPSAEGSRPGTDVFSRFRHELADVGYLPPTLDWGP